jgi:hypothetical protein
MRFGNRHQTATFTRCYAREGAGPSTALSALVFFLHLFLGLSAQALQSFFAFGPQRETENDRNRPGRIGAFFSVLVEMVTFDLSSPRVSTRLRNALSIKCRKFTMGFQMVVCVQNAIARLDICLNRSFKFAFPKIFAVQRTQPI